MCRYMSGLRAAVVACTGVLTLIAAPGEHYVAALGVVVALNAWSVVYLLLVFRGLPRWLLPVDTGVIAAVCLAEAWTEPGEAVFTGTSRVLVIVSITVVAHQWHTTPLGGFAITAACIAAYLAGVALAEPQRWVEAIPLALWSLVEAALTRGLFRLIQRGAQAADRITDRESQTREEATVAAARRAEQHEYLAALHDTAASTMLAVGTGMVGRPSWLAEQAAGDLDVLSGRQAMPEGKVDLGELIAQAVRRSRVRVERESGPSLEIPASPGVAICRSVREALSNVARHAGVDSASVQAAQHGDVIVVEVIDHGRGFDPRQVSPHRRGVSSSIVDRMARAGGLATVESEPGRGTRIRLEWPRD